VPHLPIPVELYLSPIETHCSNIEYFPTVEKSLDGGDTEEMTRLHLARGVIALFVLSFLAVVCAFFTGLSGKLLHLCSAQHNLLTKLFSRRLLETFSWSNHSHSHSDANCLSACQRRNGTLAHG